MPIGALSWAAAAASPVALTGRLPRPRLPSSSALSHGGVTRLCPLAGAPEGKHDQGHRPSSPLPCRSPAHMMAHLSGP